jgi:hypothetical protein
MTVILSGSQGDIENYFGDIVAEKLPSGSGLIDSEYRMVKVDKNIELVKWLAVFFLLTEQVVFFV